jgi:hypothetical protein
MARRVGQEGSRWYNEPPSGEDLSKWFKENVPIHDGLDHKDYLPGVTLIPSTEKVKQVTGWQGENPVIAKVENLVYVPYAKVETRVKYFHDLMTKKESEWVGIIEPISPNGADDRLPPGFFTYLIPTGENVGVRYICCTMKVTVYKRDGFEEVREVVDTRRGLYQIRRVGQKVIDAPPATKMIPVTSSWNQKISADDTAIMKAETGAVGRALGLAGMLVIPGTGVATAEDMREVEAQQSGAIQSADETEVPAAVPAGNAGADLNSLRQAAADDVNKLKNEFPDRFKLFQEWAQERGIGKLDEVEDATVLRGIAVKAQKEMKEAETETEKS